MSEFESYVWSFYGPGQIYGHFFDGTLTENEVRAACALRWLQDGCEGDSMDREIVRDLMLVARGKQVQGL